MKKQIKLGLKKVTLRNLEEGDLGKMAGGTDDGGGIGWDWTGGCGGGTGATCGGTCGGNTCNSCQATCYSCPAGCTYSCANCPTTPTCHQAGCYNV